MRSSFPHQIGKEEGKYDSRDDKMAQSYITLEEKMNTHFNNPTSTTSTSFNPPSKKKPRWRKEDADERMYGRYNKYTPLNTTRNKIYHECANIEFQKKGTRPSFHVWTYYGFH